MKFEFAHSSEIAGRYEETAGLCLSAISAGRLAEAQVWATLASAHAAALQVRQLEEITRALYEIRGA
jgi:hypothetical protein